MLGKLLQPEIEGMLARAEFAGLREVISGWPSADLAELIDDLPEEDQVSLFRLMPKAVATEVFEYLDVDAQEHLLRSLGQENAVSILNQMSADDRTALLEELPPDAVKRLLQLLSPSERAIANSLLGYPEHSVGRLMTPDFLAVRDQWTVQQVLDHVRANGRDSETLNVLYVVDDTGRLIDDIRIREFLLRPLNTPVREIRDENYHALSAMDDQEVAIAAFRKYDRNTLPVTDTSGMLLGIVTVDDVLDIAEEEATEDIQKMGGTEALTEPYMDVSIPDMIKKRAVWLVVLFVGELLTASAMGFFEQEIAKAVVLALFVPLIISSGGNSGSQAATLVIRAMALGEVTLGDWWRVMRREIISGLALGGILGLLGFSRIALWSAFSPVYGEHWFLVGCTVGCALLGIVLWGTLAGSMLPFLLRRLGLDPATSSAPFVATLVDVTGLVLYFSLAILFLRGTLL